MRVVVSTCTGPGLQGPRKLKAKAAFERWFEKCCLDELTNCPATAGDEEQRCQINANDRKKIEHLDVLKEAGGVYRTAITKTALAAAAMVARGCDVVRWRRFHDEHRFRLVQMSGSAVAL